MLRVPARNYSKVSNTRSGLPGLRVKSPNTNSVGTLLENTRLEKTRRFLDGRN